MHPMVHNGDERESSVVHTFHEMHVSSALHLTCGFARVIDTCELCVNAVARVCARYSGVLHVCMYTMLDSTTLHFFEYRIEQQCHAHTTWCGNQ